MSNLDDHALQASTVVSHESGNMSDELNVWRDAKSMQEYRPLPSQAAADELSAAVIRDYGNKRYQQAIADVVEWLRSRAADDIASSTNCRRGNAGKTLIRFAQRRTSDANELIRRFGKDA